VVVTGLQTRAGTRCGSGGYGYGSAARYPFETRTHAAGTAGFFFVYLHVASVIFTGFGTQMSAANPLFTYLLCLGTNIPMGSDAPRKGELVEAASYILVDVYHCLVPVNEHERRRATCSCSFTGTKQ
jgi:hypothetical protein